MQLESFKDRLKYLYSEKGIDTSVRGWAGPVAAAFFERGILQYTDTGKGQGVSENQRGQRNSIKTQLLRHIDLESIEQLNTVWVLRYCRFFDCSAAFLFGEIPLPTIEQTDICKVTGLSASAVKTLTDYRENGAVEKQLRDTFEGSAPAAVYNLLPDTVSFLLRPEHCEQDKAGFLHLVGQYLTSDDLRLGSSLPKDLQIESYNGSGIQLDTAEIIRSALPNMILDRLHEYRAERLQHRKKP